MHDWSPKVKKKTQHTWQVEEPTLPPSRTAPANIWFEIKKETNPDAAGSLSKNITKQNSNHMHHSY